MAPNQEELQAALRRVSGTTLDVAGAANAWAGTTGLELLGALNAKAGTTGLGMDAVLTTLGGGGATTLRLPPDDKTLHPIHATYGDEMDAVPLGGSWTKRNIAQAEVLVAATNWAPAGVTIPFDAQGDAIYRAAPTGDFELVCGFTGDEYGGMTGLLIVDSNGTGVGYSPYFDFNVYCWAVTAWNYASSGPNNGAPSPRFGQRYWLALKKVGTAYTGRFSTDGLTWTAFTTAATGPATAAYIGVGRIYTSGGTNGTFTLRRFNVYPSPTYYT